MTGAGAIMIKMLAKAVGIPAVKVSSALATTKEGTPTVRDAGASALKSVPKSVGAVICLSDPPGFTIGAVRDVEIGVGIGVIWAERPLEPIDGVSNLFSLQAVAKTGMCSSSMQPGIVATVIIAAIAERAETPACEWPHAHRSPLLASE